MGGGLLPMAIYPALNLLSLPQGSCSQIFLSPSFDEFF
ncbi:hypothetical protein C4J99_1179 [Pseudomonas synxantha]|nr:hypothetical protein C4J99_1179 [Pseudomonas synxantha]